MTKTLLTPLIATSVIAAIVLAGFFVWYNGAGSPLTQQEQDAYMSRVSTLESSTQGYLDAEVIRKFLSTDDGQPFFVINLFKFRPIATYSDGRASTANGVEAFKQYSRVVLPLSLRRGTHPAFMTEPGAGVQAEWNLVTVVRYRSRRDYVEIVTDPAYLAVLPHRLAAAERNIRIQLPGTVIPNPMLALFTMLVSILVIVGIFQSRSRLKLALT